MRFYTSKNDWFAHSQYKYIKREWKNGQWVYTYPDDVNGGSSLQSANMNRMAVRALDKAKDVRYAEQQRQINERKSQKRGLDRLGEHHMTITTSVGKNNSTTHYIDNVKIGNDKEYEDFEKRRQEQKEGEKRERREKIAAIPGNAVKRVKAERARKKFDLEAGENRAMADAKKRAMITDRQGKHGTSTMYDVKKSTTQTGYINKEGTGYETEAEIRKRGRRDAKKARRKVKVANARKKVDELFGK